MLGQASELLQQLVDLGRAHLANQDEYEALRDKLRRLHEQMRVFCGRLSGQGGQGNELAGVIANCTDRFIAVLERAVRYIAKSAQRNPVMRFMKAHQTKQKYADIHAEIDSCAAELDRALGMQMYLRVC
jgi:hypothetical protein